MINIKKLTKFYCNNPVIKDVNLQLPRYGLIAIVGPSGCGKTTLLNCLSGLIDYDGEIYIDSQRLKVMKANYKDEYRLKNIGFVYQDFKLYENETVGRNILLPLEIISNEKKYRKKRKCQDLMNIVGLKMPSSQLAKKLSGGEKQRVAIARALINEPKIVLADEPTGSLDSKTAEEIMSILERISLKSLVIIVSHDQALMNRYADQIVEMKDGQICQIHHQNKHQHGQYLPICKNRSTNKKPTIPFSFLVNHSLSVIKQRPWRNIITEIVTSFGLIGIGISFCLSNSISANIKSSYSSLMGEEKIMVSLKDTSPSLYGRYAGNYYEASTIAKEFSPYINDIGVTYYNSFESMFNDHNELVMADSTYHYQIDEISARSINEFQWLDLNHDDVYPQEIKNLADDEVVFGLTIKMVEDICYALKIKRTVLSLSNYLSLKTIPFYFDFANYEWQYADQQLVTMKGFVLRNQSAIYHSNHLWNEYMFETMMHLPITDSLDDMDMPPWTMRKIYYFQTFGNTDEFIRNAYYSPTLDSYLLEIGNLSYYPWLYKDVPISQRNRVLFFAKTIKSFPLRYASFFLDACSNIDNTIYASSGSYVAFPASLMIGFARPLYFSFNQASLNTAIDTISMFDASMSESIELSHDVLSGYFAQNINNGVSFKPFKGEILKGQKPNSVNEIAISSGMAMHLFGSLSVLNKNLYLAFTTHERVNSEGKTIRDFSYQVIKVVCVIDSPKNTIYHDSDWTLSFFQSRLGVSAFDLGVTTISFDVIKRTKSQETISKLSKAFPDYTIINPMSDINESIDEMCSYLQIIIVLFSAIAFLISILLLTICNHLYIFENQKDIGLARCLGVNKKEAKKFLYINNGITCFICFVISSLELLIINEFISLEIAHFLGSSWLFSFNPISLLWMFVLAVLISFVSTLFIGKSISSLSPLAAIER
ncbi:MAG: ATP-binding cassette domain-containing protein [Bacilli bacterium]